MFITTVSTLVLSCVLLLVARDRGRGLDALARWAISVGFGAVGTAIYAAPLPETLAQDLARGLLITAAVLSWSAALVFSGRRVRPTAAMVGPLLWVVACVIPDLGASVVARVVVFGVIGTIYRVLTVVALWRDNGEHLPSRVPALILLSMQAVLYVVRPVTSFMVLDPRLDQIFLDVLLFEGQLYAVGMAFVLIAMTKERAEREASRNLDVARRAGEARARFLTQMSHEVRSPLIGMLGLARLLSRDPTLRPDQRNYLETLEAAGSHLLSVVDKALGLPEPEMAEGALARQEFNPTEAIAGCVAMVREIATARHILLRFRTTSDVPEAIMGDPIRFREIMLNLLWNALNLSPDGRTVTIGVTHTAGASEAGGSRNVVNCEVTDTGPAMPRSSDMQPAEPAYQNETQGSGASVGMEISARLARRMGGTLTYDPGLSGIGNTFRLTLPSAMVEGEQSP